MLSSAVKISFPEVLTPVVETYIFSPPSFVTLVSFFFVKPNSQEANVSLTVRKKKSYPVVASFKLHKPASSLERERLRHLLETCQLRIAFGVLAFVYCERIMVICFFLKLDCSNKVVPSSCIHLVRVQADTLTS